MAVFDDNMATNTAAMFYSEHDHNGVCVRYQYADVMGDIGWGRGGMGGWRGCVITASCGLE